MLSNEQIEAAAKAIALSDGWSEDDWENSDGPPHHVMIRHAKAALIAAEQVQKARLSAAEDALDFIAGQIYADSIVAHERRIWEAIEEYRAAYP